MEMLSRLKLMLPGEAAGDELLGQLLLQAGEFITAYTGRALVPEALQGAQVRLAVQMYNRLGTEGERARHEGGLTLHWDAVSGDILHQLRAYRLGALP